MSVQSIIDFLGSEEQAIKVCKEMSCLAELGRKVSADYVAQARIGRFERNLTIGVELYSSKSGAMVGSFTGDSKSLKGGLRDVIEVLNDCLYQNSISNLTLPRTSVRNILESGIMALRRSIASLCG